MGTKKVWFVCVLFVACFGLFAKLVQAAPASGGSTTTERVTSFDGSPWFSMGDGVGDDAGRVSALALSGDETVLFAASNIEGEPVSRVRKWNGSNWELLPGIFNAPINKLLHVGGSLYAVGNFTSIIRSVGRSTTALRVAVLHDGARTWEAMGELNGAVKDIVALGGTVCVAGEFTIPISSLADDTSYIGCWNGTLWQPDRNSPSSRIERLEYDSSRDILYAATNNDVGGYKVFAKERGEWTGIGRVIGGDVRALELDAYGNLYIGGDFRDVDGTVGTCNGMAEWHIWDSGRGWVCDSTLVPGRDDYWTISSLVYVNGKVYAGGFFATISGSGGNFSANNIFVEDAHGLNNRRALVGAYNARSSSATAVNRNGTDDLVKTMVAESDGTLYVGGDFSHAGGIAVNRVAGWK